MRLTSAEMRLKLGRANIKLFSRWNFRLMQRVNESVLLKYLTNIIWHYLTYDKYLESDSKSIYNYPGIVKKQIGIFSVFLAFILNKRNFYKEENT